MLILPQLFFGGSGADIIAISTSGSRLAQKYLFAIKVVNYSKLMISAHSQK